MTPDQFLQLADQFSEAALLLSKDGTVLAANQATCSLGCSLSRLTGRPLAEVVSASPDTIRDYLRLCSRSRHAVLGSLDFVDDSGRTVPCRCYGSVIHHHRQGGETRILLRLICKDGMPSLEGMRKFDELSQEVRRRKQAEESLRQAVERHSAMEEHLTTLVQASATLTGTLQPQAVLSSILQLSQRLIPADAYAVWRYHARRGQWHIAGSSGLSQKYQQDTIREMTGTPLMLDEPIVAHDVLALPILAERKAGYESEGIRSLLAVPLRIHGVVCGTLVVYHRQPHCFDEFEVRLATAVANLSAAAIGSADLFEEQARLRAEAQEHKERLRVTLASIGDAVVATDIDGRVTFLNPVAQTLTGWTFEEAEGQPLEQVFRIIDESSRQPVENPVVKALRHGGIVDLANHTLLIAKDGTERSIADSAAPIRNEQGEISGVVLIFRDITLRKQAEEALRESEQRFRAAVDQAAVGVALVGLDYQTLFVNRGLCQILGYTETELRQLTFVDVTHPDDLEYEFEQARRLLAGEINTCRYEKRYRHKNGSIVWGDLSAAAVRDQQGNLKYLVAILVDVTERRRAEQDALFLADASAALAGLVDYESTLQKVARLAVPSFADWCAVDMLDETGTLRRLAVAHVDPAKVELAHEIHRRFPPNPSTPRGVWQVLRTGESEIISEITDELLAENIKEPERLKIMRELGLKSYLGVPLRVRDKVLGVVTFISAESGRRYDVQDLAVAEDLAHRAAVAIENVRLYQALREADQRKDEFLALLGHELRNPLAPISNALHILKLPGADKTITERARMMMERQVEHMVRLVDDLLDVSRIMRGKVELRREPVELTTVIARAVETAQPMIDAEGHELILSLSSEPMWVSGDLVRLAQVVGNLLNNAAKYTERGGRISVTTERDAGTVVIRVRDNGIGISAEMLPRIFDMFVQAERRTKNAQGGLGIGLSLVRGLVELHDGTLEAHSAGFGTGSEFIVRLPLLIRGAHQDYPAPGRLMAPAARLPSQRILVVDDSVDAADSLAILLRLEGQDVTVAYDGASALSQAAAHPPAIAFLDLGMPMMDGYELARRLRAQSALQEVTLIALTGWGQPEDRQRTRQAGFDHHLVKPVEAETLHQLLQQHAQNSPRRAAPENQSAGEV